VTTFQLLEDCAQGYEQRICAHGNQTSPGDLLLIATIPAPPKLASCSALRLAAWSPALPLCEYFRRRRQTRSRLSCMQETPTNLAAGVISAQGSFRSGDASPVFPIIGGTGTYELAQGTITLDHITSNRGLPVGRPLAPICESRAGYIGETALTDVRGASVSRDIGCGYEASNGWTRHRHRARGCSQPEAVNT
jgi:hypothetical protein